MKRSFFSLTLLLSLVLPIGMHAADVAVLSAPGLTNPEWMYVDKDSLELNKKHPCYTANVALRDGNYPKAVQLYTPFIESTDADPYDRDMAKLCCASAHMAMEEPAPGFIAAENLTGIPQEKRLPLQPQKIKGKSILVTTDGKIGLGDAEHFKRAAYELRQLGLDVTICAPFPLVKELTSIANSYGIHIVSSKDPQPETDYITHMMAAFARTEMTLGQLYPPDRMLYRCDEQAMAKICALFRTIQEPRVLVANRGVEVTANLIGGLKLSGRHADSDPFEALLQGDKSIGIVDIGYYNPEGCLVIKDPELNKRIYPLPQDNKFDTHGALAQYITVNAEKPESDEEKKEIAGVVTDNGPSNIVVDKLNPKYYYLIAHLIPYIKAQDVRMVPNPKTPHDPLAKQYPFGKRYSNRIVPGSPTYACTTRKDQTKMIEQISQEMFYKKPSALPQSSGVFKLISDAIRF